MLNDVDHAVVSLGELDLRNLVEAAGVGLHSVGADGTILWANAADHEMLGYAASAYVGHRIEEFHADAGVISEILARLHAGERLVNVPARLRHKHGTIREVLITSSAHFDRDGRFRHTCCFTLDITHRKAAEHALRRANDRLRVALEAGAMGTWEWEIAAGRVTWSPTLEAIHGMPVGSFDGTFDGYQRDIHPEDKQRVLDTIRGTLAGSEHNLEYRIVLPDGRVRWLEAHGRLVRDEAGRPLRLMGVCMDMTERKLAELARAEMTAELAKIAGFRERLLGIVAHDLRSPLQTIQTSAALLLQCDPERERAAPAIRRVLRSSERMGRMIADLLDFTHGRLGHGIPVQARRMDMASMARRIISELEAAKPSRELALSTDGDTTGVWDPDRVEQVFSNLIANALQYGEGPVAIAVLGRPDSVLVSVRNDGPPIPADVLPGLFEPFARRSRVGHGLGLGLYIVSEIVKAHRGTVAVESNAKVGTRITTRWPRAIAVA